jgi:fructoselysine-6-P-deglycase FrlB-like protein
VSVTLHEIESQPAVWSRAAELADEVRAQLPQAGQRIAVIGCGTSFYIAQAVAAARESAGAGETDAFVASEMPTGRSYDSVLAISRSGTTTEVVRALMALPVQVPSLALSAVPDSPVVRGARDAVLMPFADEESVVQTRFATAAVALLRAHVGDDLTAAIADAERCLAQPLPVDPADFEHFVFLGTGWTVGLAFEGALKFREAAGAWTEAYPAMEYRHGPISVAGPGSLVWLLGPAPDGLIADIENTGATVLDGTLDPMAELVQIQRAAVSLAQTRGLDPDQPRHLTRSVVLP